MWKNLKHRELKKGIAAKAALGHVQPGMVLGLGSGSTVTYFIQYLGEAVRDGLEFTRVSSSVETTELARTSGITLVALDQVIGLGLNVDSADEFDRELRLIKGGEGALLREKILAYNSKRNIIADSGKEAERLGSFRLPVEIIPFANWQLEHQLRSINLDSVLWMSGSEAFVTDAKVIVYNMVGRPIVQLDVPQENESINVNMESYHRGIYFIKVYAQGRFPKTIPVVKKR